MRAAFFPPAAPLRACLGDERFAAGCFLLSALLAGRIARRSHLLVCDLPLPRGTVDSRLSCAWLHLPTRSASPRGRVALVSIFTALRVASNRRIELGACVRFLRWSIAGAAAVLMSVYPFAECATSRGPRPAGRHLLRTRSARRLSTRRLERCSSWSSSPSRHDKGRDPTPAAASAGPAATAPLRVCLHAHCLELPAADGSPAQSDDTTSYAKFTSSYAPSHDGLRAGRVLLSWAASAHLQYPEGIDTCVPADRGPD